MEIKGVKVIELGDLDDFSFRSLNLKIINLSKTLKKNGQGFLFLPKKTEL